MKEQLGISLAKQLLENIVKCKVQLTIWCKFYMQNNFIYLIEVTKNLYD